jgi:hypothetical protein
VAFLHDAGSAGPVTGVAKYSQYRRFVVQTGEVIR